MFATLFAQAQQSSGVGQLVILMVLPIALYFLMIRPQKRRQKEQRELQDQIAVGDEVMTTSGIYGFVTAVEEKLVWLEIDDDVQIRIVRAAIQNKIAPSDDADDTPALDTGTATPDAPDSAN